MKGFPESRGRRIVRERSGGICELDGFRPAESWSHRKAKARGGTYAPSDGLDLCGDGVRLCHGWLEHHPNYAGEPGWYLLDDEGGRWRVDPADYGLPVMPAHFPPSAARPLATVPWVDPR